MNKEENDAEPVVVGCVTHSKLCRHGCRKFVESSNQHCMITGVYNDDCNLPFSFLFDEGSGRAWLEATIVCTVPPPLPCSLQSLLVEEGVVAAEGQYTLQCNISRDGNLPPPTLLEVMWLDPNKNTITSGTAYTISGMSSTTTQNLTSTLTIPRLTTSQGGLYSCAANLTVPDIVTDCQVISIVSCQSGKYVSQSG